MNSLVVISWHTPWKCVRVLVGTTSIRLSEDNHDSWGMCTSSARCKTVITAVLTIMSGMDPHMISGTRVGLVGLGLVSLVVYVDPPQWTLRCDRGPVLEAVEFA